jgi:predicted SprT family Zn-dependent metalloprotease
MTTTIGTYIRGGKPPESVGDRTMSRLDARRIESSVVPTEAELQLLFARLNYEKFNGEVPDCRIRYNERFSNSAGRITYSEAPLLIELSPKHFRQHPGALEETLLHEMIHAWCYDRYRDSGHGAHFKRKMRDCGLTSIYHDLGNARPRSESAKRYILRCEHCSFEVLRRRWPGRPVSCPRCNKQRFDARFPLTIYEVTEAVLLGNSLERAANRSR